MHQEPSLYTADGRRKYVTPRERAAFIAHAENHPNARAGTLCLVIAHTGCRISEALALTAANFDPDEQVVAIRCLKKRGKVVIRTVPLPPGLLRRLEVLHHLSALAPDARLFPWSRGTAWRLIKAALLESGCARGIHATCKGLRHGFGIHAVRNNVPITLIKRWLGHARLTTTEIYLDAMGAEEREFAARMWDARRA